jgi:formylglycine-generating enzyme required for sulfatase activity/serine/threonine protein kinase
MSSSNLPRLSQISRQDLRILLRAVLRMPSDLDAFCQDHYPAVYNRFTDGMDWVNKVNLLIAYGKDDEIICHLKSMYAERWEEALSDLRGQQSPSLREEIELSLAARVADLMRERETLLKWGASTEEIDSRIQQAQKEQRHGPALHLGEVLNRRYQLQCRIGKGGFADVWLARDLCHNANTPDAVAVKVLHGNQSQELSRRARFIEGARQLKALEHPHIVRVYEEVNEYQGFYYFTMEFLPNGDLSIAVERDNSIEQRLHWLRVILEVGEALEYMHYRGLIHRDVKPHNILLDAQNKSRLGDFDLLLDVQGQRRTRTAQGFGTYLYTAPEQFQNAAHVDARADIFSLGRTAMFVLYGRDLEPGAMENRDRFLAELEAPVAIKNVLSRATAADRKNRHESIAEFCDALKLALQAPSEFSTLSPNVEASNGTTSLEIGAALQGQKVSSDTLSRILTQSRLDADVHKALPGPSVSSKKDLQEENLTEGLELLRDNVQPPLGHYTPCNIDIPSVFNESSTYTTISQEVVLPNKSEAPLNYLHSEEPIPSLQDTVLQAEPSILSNLTNFWRNSPSEIRKWKPSAGSLSGFSWILARKPHKWDNHQIRIITYTLAIPLILGIIWYARLNAKNTAASPSSIVANKPIEGITSPPYQWPQRLGPIIPEVIGCPLGMVTIPEGSFLMGSEKRDREKPIHQVSVKGFCLDRTEVPVRDYKRCVDAGKCIASGTVDFQASVPVTHSYSQLCNWAKSGRSDHPMNCVSWQQARNYCESEDKRLPTEEEWEYAARGPDNRIYPWGKGEPDSDRLNACGEECYRAKKRFRIPSKPVVMYNKYDPWETTAPVGSMRKDRSPFEVMDMAGNVAEWVNDFYRESYIATDVKYDLAVVRGSSWSETEPLTARGAERANYLKSIRTADIGFRCAKTH